MKRFALLAALTAALIAPSAFAESPAPAIKTPAAKSAASPAATTNDYHVFFKALKGDGSPAVGFKVDASVKGRSKPKTLETDAKGEANFVDLPAPDMKHQLVVVLHYYTSKDDEAREITYPYISSDKTRLKDTQVIPNTSTPKPQ